MILTPLTSVYLNKITSINHGFFTRKGGVSNGIYASLNLRSSSLDNPDHLRHNRQKMADYFKIPFENLIFLNQQHYNHVHTVEHNPQKRLNGDGLVTKLQQIGLVIITADCIPMLLADPQNKIIGACHVGWKGALSGVIQNTISKMQQLGAETENIIAAMGPAIGVDSYEISKDFYEHFLKQDIKAKVFFKNKKYFDLKGYALSCLNNAGLTKIEVLANDTFTEKETFFSYRRSFKNQEPDYACQASVIMIA